MFIRIRVELLELTEETGQPLIDIGGRLRAERVAAYAQCGRVIGPGDLGEQRDEVVAHEPAWSWRYW